ncbi:MAG: hypothetical protein ACOX9E_00350 [Lentisphaeria bacterium]
MTKFGRFTLFLAFCLSLPLFAQPRFPTPAELGNAANWRNNTSGVMSISQDGEAVRFVVQFTGGDRWVYPGFSLQKEQTLNGATAITFELKLEPQDAPQKFKVALIMLEGENNGRYGYSLPPPGEWRKITVALSDRDGTSQEGIRILRLGMNPQQDALTYSIRNLSVEGTPRMDRIKSRIATKAPGTVFIENEAPTFSANIDLPQCRYVLKDWLGAVLSQGTWPERAGSELVLAPLPPGYYHLETSHPGETQFPPFTFAVVIDPTTRVVNHDAYFAVDTAQSWVARPGSFDCPYYDGDSYLLVSELIYRAGIYHVRERLSWKGVNPEPGEYNYSYYMTNADYLQERKVLISGMYHDSPPWAKPISKLPSDLLATYTFAKDAATAFGDRMGNWEFWNEQDIGFAPESAWDYAAAMKAACLGFRAADPKRIVAHGAMCTAPKGAYHYNLYANDMGKFSDIINYHTYTPLSNYPNLMRSIREFRAEQGLEQRAIWFTEHGTNSEGHSEADGVRKGLKAHSPEQELIMTEFFPKSQILMMMEGVSRDYYFVFPPYNERNGRKDWGMMRRDGSVKPSYCAMATLTAQLNLAELQGELSVDDALRVFVFDQPDGKQTLVFWSISDLDTVTGGQLARPDKPYAHDFTLPLANGQYTLTNTVGTASILSVANGQAQLRASRYPQYLAGVSGFNADIAKVPEGKIDPYTPAADEDLSVVIRANLNNDDFDLANQKASANLDKLQGRLSLEIWNLDDQPKTATMQISGGALSNLPESIILPAFGKHSIESVFTPELPAKGYEAPLIVQAIANGKKSSRLHIPVLMRRLFVENCLSIPLQADKPENWRKNTSADHYSVTWDEQEQALRFDLEWTNPETDRWFYPEYVLKLPAESFDGAEMLSFDVKSVQDKVENDFRFNFVMLVQENVHEHGRSVNLAYPAPLTQWENRLIALNNNKDNRLAPTKIVRIGANPIGMKISFWIKNVRLLKNK